mmetsp:Transcript_44271/g.104808  ORF Transcript_44271/g.104808 Transcript_44271/m.104808 type:complete len:200 (-) Transcript_44271:138-737(-)
MGSEREGPLLRWARARTQGTMVPASSTCGWEQAEGAPWKPSAAGDAEASSQPAPVNFQDAGCQQAVEVRMALVEGEPQHWRNAGKEYGVLAMSVQGKRSWLLPMLKAMSLEVLVHEHDASLPCCGNRHTHRHCICKPPATGTCRTCSSGWWLVSPVGQGCWKLYLEWGERCFCSACCSSTAALSMTWQPFSLSAVEHLG